MGQPMGLNSLVAGDQVTFKRKFRWLFTIPDVTPQGMAAIPSIKSARPHYTFKEHGVQHLAEEIFFPMKAEWKPITLTLYDIGRTIHPIVEWISMVYTMNNGNGEFEWYPSSPGKTANGGGTGAQIGTTFKRTCKLELFDGCGATIEKWKFENAWPQSVDFSDLDYGSSDVLLCTVTLRYDRAAWVSGC